MTKVKMNALKAVGLLWLLTAACIGFVFLVEYISARYGAQGVVITIGLTALSTLSAMVYNLALNSEKETLAKDEI